MQMAFVGLRKLVFLIQELRREDQGRIDDGSPNVSDIELTRWLNDNWAGIINCLRNFELLRRAGVSGRI